MPNLTKERVENKLSHPSSVKNLPIVALNVSKNSKLSPKSIELLKEGLSHLQIQVFDVENADDINKDTSIIVLLSEDEDFLKTAWQNGIVPVTSEFNTKIEDYNPNTEKGNSFVFNNFNEWEVFAAVVRALETHKFPYDWKFIKRSCTKSA